MKTKTFFVLLLFSAFSLSMCAQTDMKAAEASLLTTLLKLRSNNPEMDLKTVSNQFETDLKKVLSHKESWHYKFPELRKYIDIERSKDKKIRTFGWDSRMGGSWHAYNTFIQHKTEKGLCVLSLQNKKVLDDEELHRNEAYRDAVIVDIHTFHNGYLLEGFGTHGSGHHHKVLTYYELVNDQLERKEIFDNNQSIYVFLIPRKYDFDLEVDVQTKTITHSEFVMDNDIGFYLPTEKQVTLTFDGKKFNKTTKKK